MDMNRRELGKVGAGLAAAMTVGSIPGPAFAATDIDVAALRTWLTTAFNDANSREGFALNLLPDIPSGCAWNSCTNNHNIHLQRTYWLDDNATYGSVAFGQFNATIGNAIASARLTQFGAVFPGMCRNTFGPVVGVKAAFDGGPLYGGPGYPFTPTMWQKPVVTSYPDPASPGFDGLQLPIVGTGYPGAMNGTPGTWTSFGSARDWFKYGCLPQVMLGNKGQSTDPAGTGTGWGMLKQGLLYWDGTGIATSTAGTYFSRDLAFALMCAKACGMPWTTAPLPTIRYVLYLMQDLPANVGHGFKDGDGGIWTNFTYNQVVQNSGKKTCEIGPLALLAYGPNIWHP